MTIKSHLRNTLRRAFFAIATALAVWGCQGSEGTYTDSMMLGVDDQIKEKIQECHDDLDKLQALVDSLEGQQDVISMLSASRYMARSYIYQSRHAKAYVELSRLEQYAEQYADTFSLVSAYYFAGLMYAQTGYYNQAQNKYFDALHLYDDYKRHPHREMQAIKAETHNGLAMLFMKIGEYEDADTLLKMALAEERELKNNNRISKNLNALGLLRLRQRRFDEAQEYFDRAAKVDKMTEGNFGLANYHHYRGALADSLGQWALAIDHYHRAQDAMRAKGREWQVLEIDTSLINLYLRQGKQLKAAQLARQTLPKADSIGHLKVMLHIYEMYYYGKLGYYAAPKEQYKYHNKVHLLSDSIEKRKQNEQIVAMRLIHERVLHASRTKLMTQLYIEEQYIRQLAFLATLSGLLLLAAVVYMLYRRRHRKQLKKERDAAIEARNEAIEAKDEAVRANKMKTAFLNSISHEIRTPLNQISGFTGLLSMDDLDPEERKRYNKIVLSGVENLTKILNNIIELSQIITSKGKPELADVNINRLCQTQIDEAKRSLRSHAAGKTLAFSLTADRDYTAKTNSIYLSNVLAHLLDNAVKFTDSGSVDVAISEFRDIEERQRLRITITDTGKGIPEDKQEWVFEQFTKVDDFASGVGIGLYLCRHILTRLGGTINIDSTYKDGCRVIVDL